MQAGNGQRVHTDQRGGVRIVSTLACALWFCTCSESRLPPGGGGLDASSSHPDAATAEDGGDDAGGDAGPLPRCDQHTLDCEDQAILKMDLKTRPASGTITTVEDGTGFLSTIDARAGGPAPTESYVYARFTTSGLEKVDVHDQHAIMSADWDIAFRRFVIRLNGGDSGPSCVQAVALGHGTSYDSVTSEPPNLTYTSDDFFEGAPQCTFRPDQSGLETSPNTVLASYFAYSGCVAMTGNVYIVKLADSRTIKLSVTKYYGTNQAQCDGTGTPGTNGAMVTIRWAYL